jgi:hypothetical protein
LPHRCRQDTAKSPGLLWTPGPLPLPLRFSPLASAHYRRLPPPLPCPRHGPG